MEETIKLLKEAGLEIRDSQLFIQALTHRSYIHENSGSNSNERLEFLGDAVLGLVMGELLYERFPTWPEGTLSRVRSSLVREDTLAEVALSLHIGASLRLGKGEEVTGGRKRPSILADAVEAILAACYLEGGLKAARAFVEKIMKPWLDKAEQYGKKLPDSKTRLQELLQINGAVNIRYDLIEEIGEDQERRFRMGLWVNDEKRSEGLGKSKKEAEQQAAAQALIQIDKESEKKQ